MKATIFLFASIYSLCCAILKVVAFLDEKAISEKVGIEAPSIFFTVAIVSFFCFTSFLFAYLAKQSKQSK